MTLDEQITILEHNSEYERTHGNLQGCLDFRRLVEWLKDYKCLLSAEQHINCPFESIDEMIDEIKNAKMLRCKDNKGNIFVSEKDLFEFIKNTME